MLCDNTSSHLLTYNTARLIQLRRGSLWLPLVISLTIVVYWHYYFALGQTQQTTRKSFPWDEHFPIATLPLSVLPSHHRPVKWFKPARIKISRDKLKSSQFWQTNRGTTGPCQSLASHAAAKDPFSFPNIWRMFCEHYWVRLNWQNRNLPQLLVTDVRTVVCSSFACDPLFSGTIAKYVCFIHEIVSQK